MKYKTTAKEVKEGYHYIISIGYCDAQYLLNYCNPIAYAKGPYGWKFDIYELDGNVAVCTGYNPVSSKNTKKDYAIVREYNDKARGKNREEVMALLEEFKNKMLDIKI